MYYRQWEEHGITYAFSDWIQLNPCLHLSARGIHAIRNYTFPLYTKLPFPVTVPNLFSSGQRFL